MFPVLESPTRVTHSGDQFADRNLGEIRYQAKAQQDERTLR